MSIESSDDEVSHDLDDPDSASSRHRKRSPSYYTMIKTGYNELCNAIIRPPRASYDLNQLGPCTFKFLNRRYARTDFDLNTIRGQTLKCSHWEPCDRSTASIPCLIYMHGNSSARVEAVGILSSVLQLGISCFAFDFAGSGLSDGDYVTLGCNEKEDLQCVIKHLMATPYCSGIALWGRSMGAATAIMHSSRDAAVACLILDSPYSDLQALALEMVNKGRERGLWAPNLVVSAALSLISGSVKRTAGFNISDVSPIKHAPLCLMPALFVAGEDDKFVDPSHSKALYSVYGGDKNLILVEGDHNSARPSFMFDSVAIFLRACLQLPADCLDGPSVPDEVNLLMPPWYSASRKERDDEHLTMHQFLRTMSENSPKEGGGGNGTTTTEQSRTATSNGGEGKSTTTGAGKAAAGRVGVDGVKDLGMTEERQQAVQDSIGKMLLVGGGGGGGGGFGGGGGVAKQPAKKAHELPQPTVAVLPPLPPAACPPLRQTTAAEEGVPLGRATPPLPPALAAAAAVVVDHAAAAAAKAKAEKEEALNGVEEALFGISIGPGVNFGIMSEDSFGGIDDLLGGDDEDDAPVAGKAGRGGEDIVAALEGGVEGAN